MRGGSTRCVMLDDVLPRISKVSVRKNGRESRKLAEIMMEQENNVIKAVSAIISDEVTALLDTVHSTGKRA